MAEFISNLLSAQIKLTRLLTTTRQKGVAGDKNKASLERLAEKEESVCSELALVKLAYSSVIRGKLGTGAATQVFRIVGPGYSASSDPSNPCLASSVIRRKLLTRAQGSVCWADLQRKPLRGCTNR